MRVRSILALTALATLAACGGGETTGGNTTSAVAPVAGKAAPAGQQWTDVVERTADGGWRKIGRAHV